MTPGSDSDCVDDLKRAFSVYDQTVDVVSCWQSYFTWAYKDHLTFFDRYPEVPQADLTPDFTVLLGNYGLVGEVKRSFPREDLPFDRTLEQIQHYDAPMSIKSNSDGSRVVPETQDIMLLLFSPSDSYAIARRIRERIEDGRLSVQNNLVLVEAFFENTEPRSRYVFRKVHTDNRPFRDSLLPKELRLEEVLGLHKESIKVYPEHFKDFKVKEVFCNDNPPPLYTAVYLWTKVFFTLLDKEQIATWRKGNPRRSVPLLVEIPSLTAQINSAFVRGGSVRTSWISDALEFLRVCDLAMKESPGKFTVQYHNLSSHSYADSAREGGSDVTQATEEYVDTLARRYCEGLTKEVVPPPPATTTGPHQTRLPVE